MPKFCPCSCSGKGLGQLLPFASAVINESEQHGTGSSALEAFAAVSSRLVPLGVLCCSLAWSCLSRSVCRVSASGFGGVFHVGLL